MWNGLIFWFTPLIMIASVILLLRRRRSLKLALFFYAGIPLWPSQALKHLFPGVFTPPDPAHGDPVPTYVDGRPDPELPAGVRRQTD